MEKRLQFRHRHWHWHILDYTSIRHCTTSYESLHLKGKRRSTLPLRLSSGSQHRHGDASPHTRLRKHPPLYNRLWAIVFKKGNDHHHFHFVCRAEVNIATEKRLQFQHWHRQHNPWLGPRGCVRESTTVQLVGAVPSIQYTASTAGLYEFSNTITIQQDCVLPSEERLTGSQDSWSWPHNRLPILGSMRGRMVVWEELTAWHGLASVFWLLSSVCVLSVFSMA